MQQLGGEESALWLTANDGLDGLPVIEHGLGQHQGRQKPDGTAGATCLLHIERTRTMPRSA